MNVGNVPTTPVPGDGQRPRAARPLGARILWWVTGVGVLLIIIPFAFIMAVWFKLPNGHALHRALGAQQQCARLVDRQGVFLAASCPSGTDAGEFTPFDSLPRYFIEDLQFFEDRRFMWHYGVSPSGLVRALLGHGGGSTLTMQVARLLMAFKDRTFYRKALEVVLAMKLELYLTKGEILELYVNISRFGEGPRVGIASASRRYFSKSPSLLSRSEGILLISFLPRPARASDTRVAERVRVYESRVRRLFNAGRIAETSYTRLPGIPSFDRWGAAPDYNGLFVAQAERELDQIAAYIPDVRQAGVLVETTIDKASNEAVAGALQGSLGCCPDARGSAVVLDPNGKVLAYTLDRPARRGDQDLIAADATMPASQAKTVLYTLFIDSLLRRGLTPQQVLAYPLPTTYRLDRRRAIRDPGPSTITLRDAVVRSRNAPVYWIANDFFRPARVALFAGSLGLVMPPIRSIGLGQTGMSQLALAVAYSSILLRGGQYHRPMFIHRIMSARGDTVFYNSADVPGANAQLLVSSATSRMMRQLLREVVYREEGTAHTVVSGTPELMEYDLAAKTGTSSGSAWGFRGVTGVVGESATFSILIQGRRLPAAGVVAGPAAAAVVGALTSGGHQGGPP